MAALTCYVGDLRNVEDPPSIDSLLLHPQADGASQTIGDVFQKASGVASIDVEIDWSRRDAGAQIPRAAPLPVGFLFDGLDKLLASNVKQPAVGLLLADYLDADLAQFGAMFDLDTDDGIIGPRQGCAIFVGAIRDALSNAQRGDDAAALLEFVAYTAVHELGHALNLWHVGASFMQPYPRPDAPGPYVFTDKQKEYLALAANPQDVRFVLPGHECSNYGQRPDGWTGLDDSNPFEGPPSVNSGLAFKIALSHQSFYSFEPVELDVCLAISGKPTTPVVVPNELDPGYDSFQIWITDPSGERRRFKSPARFCRSNGVRTISAKTPYRRDISIFRQSGGSTFRSAGRHWIQAAFRISPQQLLWSNVLECEVKSADQASDAWVAGRRLLACREGRNLLRFKSTAPSAYGYAGLKEFASRHASKETAAAIHYALGKSLLNLARQGERSKRPGQLRRLGLGHLEAALASDRLGAHRRRVIERLVSTDGAAEPMSRRSGARRVQTGPVGSRKTK